MPYVGDSVLIVFLLDASWLDFVGTEITLLIGDDFLEEPESGVGKPWQEEIHYKALAIR